jgi:hypothetical protein
MNVVKYETFNKYEEGEVRRVLFVILQFFGPPVASRFIDSYWQECGILKQLTNFTV